MKKIFLIFSFTLFFNASHASTYSLKYKTALKMLDTMNKNKILERHIQNMIKIQVAQNPILSMKQQEVSSFFAKHLNYTKLRVELARIYTKELTLQEMKQFTAFFDTSVGQKMILKMPRLLQLGSILGQKKIQERYPELIETFLKR